MMLSWWAWSTSCSPRAGSAEALSGGVGWAVADSLSTVHCLLSSVHTLSSVQQPSGPTALGSGCGFGATCQERLNFEPLKRLVCRSTTTLSTIVVLSTPSIDTTHSHHPAPSPPTNTLHTMPIL